MMKGMAITKDERFEFSQPCEPCLHGKQTRQPIATETTDRKMEILACIYSDVCGKMQTKSCTGYKYFVTFIEDASRLINLAFLKEKGEVLQHFKVFIEQAEVKTGKRVEVLRGDGGGEYGSKAFKSYLKSKGIHHEKTNAYTPQENGVVEWMNHTLVESARAICS
jgi:hypothetical protein